MAFLIHPRFQAIMRLLFWLAAALAVLMALLPQPPELPIDGYGDKTAHMLAFATLSILAAFGFPAALRWRIAERLSFLGALIEVVQSIPGLKRQCDVTDWIADTVAIVVATAVVSLLMSLRQSSAQQAR